MEKLASTLRTAFEHISGDYISSDILLQREDIRFFEIPISSDSFEVPLFALAAFQNHLVQHGSTNSVDKFVATLRCLGARTSYISFNSAFRKAVNASLHSSQLVALPLVKDTSLRFYAVKGALFDNDFNPLVLLTWQLAKSSSTDRYQFVRPVLRVHPNVFINKNNSVERYIINRIVPAALSLPYVYMPEGISNQLFEVDYLRSFMVKTIIDGFPFTTRQPDVPTIDTTNERLLQAALDHIDELLP